MGAQNMMRTSDVKYIFVYIDSVAYFFLFFFFSKRPIYLHTYGKCSKRPFNISTMLPPLSRSGYLRYLSGRVWV